MTREPWDASDDAWDPQAGTDFFGAPRSKGGRSGSTGEFRILDESPEPADSGRARHRNPDRRGRTPSNVGSSAVAGVAGAVAARSSAIDRVPTPRAPSDRVAADSGPVGRGPAGRGPAGRATADGATADHAAFRAGGTAETKLVVSPPRPRAAPTGGRLAGLRRLLRRRWFAPSMTGGVVLCSVAFVTGITQFAGAACAAVPPPGRTLTGEATFFDGDVGNCSYPSLPDDDLYVALGPAEYSDAAACGGYLDVTGPSGSVRVKVVDQCPECAAGHVDLSREAFTRIADPEAGVVPITYSAVADPVVPKLSVRVKEGSSEFFLAILIDNHGNPLSKVEVGGESGFEALSRTSFNYWVADGGLGAGPFPVRVTDTAGRTATIPDVTLSPGSVQQSTVGLGGGTAVAAPTTKAAAAPSATRTSPANSGSPRAAAGRGSTSAGPPSGSSTSSAERSENDTEAAVTPDADASQEIAAAPAPSSSVAVPRAIDSTSESTGRNTCG